MNNGFIKRIKAPIIKWYSIFLRRRKFRAMAYQKNKLIDPATGKRAKYWKKCGAHIKGTVNIGYNVYFDATNANYITIEDGVWIAANCIIFCHKRDLKQYYVGDDYNQLPHFCKPVTLKKGCCIGMGSIIMPGVTIGEGAMIGAGSVVTRDIPAWTIATGNPATVVKEIPKRQIQTVDE